MEQYNSIFVIRLFIKQKIMILNEYNNTKSIKFVH